MIPTLKATHGDNIRRRVAKLMSNPGLLQEEISAETLDKMGKALQKLNALFKSPEMKDLSSFHLGLKKAHDDLTEILSYGDVMSWGHELLPTGLTAIGRINKFESGVIRLFQKLPKIIEIVKGSEKNVTPVTRDPKQAQPAQSPEQEKASPPETKPSWDPDKPLKELVSTDSQHELATIILRAMQRNERGRSHELPYIHNLEAAQEILGLTPNQITKLSSVVGRSQTIDKFKSETGLIDRDVRQLAAQVWGAMTGKKAQKEEQPEAEEQQPALLPPPKPEAPIKQKPKPTVTSNKVLTTLWDISDKAAKSVYPVRPDGTVKTDKNVEAFRDALITQFIEWMIQQGFVGKQPAKKP